MNKKIDAVLGELTYDYGWIKQEEIDVWGRKIEVLITLSCFSNEDITDSQRETYSWFKDNLSLVFEKTKLAIVPYCIQKNAEELSNAEFDNMYKYVKLKNILFAQDTKHCKKIALLFNYKFDKENGIAVVFENGEVKKIGMQDIAL